MFKDLEYTYNDGVATCVIFYKGHSFIGEARCHPDDEDMESERVGLTIAETRASIKVMKFIRDFEIKSQLNVLNHLNKNVQNSKYYNKNSYEARMIRRQLHAIEKELTMLNNELTDEKLFLKEYINGKDKLYKKLRAKS